MIIVCDASPLIALATCNALELLDSMFGQVYVSKQVFDEVTKQDKPFSQQLFDYLDNNAIDMPILAEFAELPLDKGELSAFSLYKKLNADYLLIDEKLGRKFAKNLGFKITGSLGILLLAKQQGLIPAIRPYVEKLNQSPIHLSQQLIDTALKLAQETL